MPSSKPHRQFTQSDLKMLLRLIPLLKSWKLVLLLVAVGFFVQYSRNLTDKKVPPKPKGDVAAAENSDVSPRKEISVVEETPTEIPSKSLPSPAATKPQDLDSRKPTIAPEKSSARKNSGKLDLSGLADDKMRIPDMVIKDQSDRVLFRGTVNLKPTLERIDQGRNLSYPNDGSVFGNRERRLPQQPREYYREWVHPTENHSGPGPQRVVTGEKREIYYTPDHYHSFRKIR